MPSQPVIYITGPNGQPEPVCLFAVPAAADELIPLEEWLENATAFAQSDPPPAPKPTEADDGFDIDNATYEELLAYLAERNRKLCLEYADTETLKAKL
ncbi:hypothetical protein Neosp_002758 [[Neocosmospora] mangrovei]